jgi:hypothetical protein
MSFDLLCRCGGETLGLVCVLARQLRAFWLFKLKARSGGTCVA